MVRAQKRGMGKMRERTARQRDKNTDRHTSRYSEACLGGLGGLLGMPQCWHQQRQSNPHRAPWTTKGGREEEEKGGARRREDGGGGDKDGGTTLVIGSLATVGSVDVINRNCTCSREPLMALNLHQAWTGGWKRKSQEQRQPASHYTLNLYSHNAIHFSLSHTHTHI